MEWLSCKLEVIFCSLVLEFVQALFFTYNSFWESIIEFLIFAGDRRQVTMPDKAFKLHSIGFCLGFNKCKKLNA